METNMIQVAYISTATEPMSSHDLQTLLHSCREHNANRGVTGMLLYGNGTFLQVLEGEERVIDELLDIIEGDPRHTGMQVLHRKAIEKREYSDWSMGFRRLNARDLQGIDGLRELDIEDFNAAYLGQHESLVQSLMNHIRRERFKTIGQSELGIDEDDAMINVLHRLIRGAVRVLAVLMVITILWGVVDVAHALYRELFVPAVTTFRMQEIVVVFGAFLAVLIAIEIFMNITLYLRDDVVHVKLVIATALMAIARKVIVFDFDKLAPMYILATAAVVLALGTVYWLMEPRTIIGARARRYSVGEEHDR
jgi:uncharacterized membrane protein (DUF373 family)